MSIRAGASAAESTREEVSAAVSRGALSNRVEEAADALFRRVRDLGATAGRNATIDGLDPLVLWSTCIPLCSRGAGSVRDSPSRAQSPALGVS